MQDKEQDFQREQGKQQNQPNRGQEQAQHGQQGNQPNRGQEQGNQPRKEKEFEQPVKR